MQFIDLHAQRLRLKENINEAIARVIDRGQYVSGPEINEFEKQIAAYIGVKHAIACANGTDALLMPLMAANIGAGDAVFCPAFTFAATAEVVALVGANPVFIDVLPDGYGINPEQLREAIFVLKKEGHLFPRAVIPVDLFGIPANYEEIIAISAEEDLFVLEDAAQSIGSRYNGRFCGTFGKVAATSFYPSKPLGCYGDGGAMFTDDDQLADTLRSLLFHGKNKTQYDNIRIGMNSRLDTLQAAILIEKLSIFKEEIEKREEIANIYSKNLCNVVKIPLVPQNCYSVYANYTIEVKNRDALKKYLQKKDIPSMIYYEKPLHLQPAYCKFPRIRPSLEVAETLSRKVLSLPMHPYLKRKDQQKIITAIRDFTAESHSERF